MTRWTALLLLAAAAILWVGNSFFYDNNSLHGHFTQLATFGGTLSRSTSVTISGSGMDWHDLASLLRPDVELYVADKRHTGLAGSHLSACTACAALYGKCPVGLADTAGLPADVARALQKAAWDTMQTYAQP